MKRILFFIVVIASLVVINNLVHSIYNLSQKKDLITQTKAELNQEKQKNTELKKLVAESTKPQFVEEQARDKLQLVKPGEAVVIMPTMPEEHAAQNVSESEKPHWQEWLEVFF